MSRTKRRASGQCWREIAAFFRVQMDEQLRGSVWPEEPSLQARAVRLGSGEIAGMGRRAKRHVSTWLLRTKPLFSGRRRFFWLGLVELQLALDKLPVRHRGSGARKGRHTRWEADRSHNRSPLRSRLSGNRPARRRMLRVARTAPSAASNVTRGQWRGSIIRLPVR